MSKQIPNLEELIERIVLSPQEIEGIIFEQSKRAYNYIINNNLSELTMITVQNGAAVYAANLKSQILKLLDKENYSLKIINDEIKIKSYKGTKSGNIQVIKDIKTSINNKFILVAEDIQDTGKTLDFLYNHLKTKNPKEIRFSVFIKRKTGYLKNYHVDVGLYTFSDGWFIGYGLDYYNHYRNLPYLAQIKDEYKI